MQSSKKHYDKQHLTFHAQFISYLRSMKLQESLPQAALTTNFSRSLDGATLKLIPFAKHKLKPFRERKIDAKQNKLLLIL